MEKNRKEENTMKSMRSKRYKGSDRRAIKSRRQRRDLYKLRLRAVKKAMCNGAKKAAQWAMVSVRTIYRWLAAYRKFGSAGLKDKKPSGNRKPRIPEDTIREIIEVRGDKPLFSSIS